MPRHRLVCPISLEQQCIHFFLRYLYDEVTLVTHLRTFEDKSMVLKSYGIQADQIMCILDSLLDNGLAGIQQELVRKKMISLVIDNLHLLAQDNPEPFVIAKSTLDRRSGDSNIIKRQFSSNVNNFSLVPKITNSSPSQHRQNPIMRLFELLLFKELKELDFGQNKSWSTEGEKLSEVARVLWKVIGEKCSSLIKLVVPKELSYSSTLNSVIRNNSVNLTHLTLKRNVPNNMFLSIVGSCCPNLQELDIAGAEVITDFGIVCLLFQDPEQIFMECWNREKTVGSHRRSQRAFPHPHFDKPIPDPMEAPGIPSPLSCKNSVGGFLYLKKNFSDVIRDETYECEKLPICKSFKKIRLENTKVKGDGASVILQSCPNIYSLGYLVFAAAGLKQVFGYERKYETNLTEIFYRGPSDQKLVTIANCCPKLTRLFLGSNSARPMNVALFEHWKNLSFITLENIFVDNVESCLSLIGHQLKGLKLQCAGFDVSQVAFNCPNLVTFVIQKESPLNSLRAKIKGQNGFSRLRHVEITGMIPKICFNFIMSNSPELRSIKAFEVPSLKVDDFSYWFDNVCKLETLLIYRGCDINVDAIEMILQNLQNLRSFGDLRHCKLRRPNDIRRLTNMIKDENWNCNLIDSDIVYPDCEEKEFPKMLSLHWFYLTEGKSK